MGRLIFPLEHDKPPIWRNFDTVAIYKAGRLQRRFRMDDGLVILEISRGKDKKKQRELGVFWSERPDNGTGEPMVPAVPVVLSFVVGACVFWAFQHLLG
jgi:hypothetical protein